MTSGPDIRAFLPRIQQAARYYLHGLYREIASKNLFLWAQAIAFKVLVTIVPIVILATGIVGRILRGDNAFRTVAEFIRDLLPPSQSIQLINFLQALEQASGTAIGIGSLGLFLSAISLFITLRIAVSNAFEQDWHVGRSIVAGYLFDVRMVLQVGLLFVLTLGASAFLQSLSADNFFLFADADYYWLREGWQRTIRLARLFVPFFISLAMFFQLYYFVPKPHPRKRSAFVGAFVASVLWEAAKQLFTYYATYVGRFDRYGSAEDGIGTLGNTFGLIIAFVFWVYFSGVLLMLGAVISSLHEHRYRTQGRLPGEITDDLPDVERSEGNKSMSQRRGPETSRRRRRKKAQAKTEALRAASADRTSATSDSHEPDARETDTPEAAPDDTAPQDAEHEDQPVR